MPYPRELRGSAISPNIKQLVLQLAARLLAGPTGVHAQLRDQLGHAEIALVTLTGAGFYANFAVPPAFRPVSPPDLIGGEVSMEVEGLDALAGSLIKVTDGRLAFVEVYTLGDVGWPDDPRVLSYGEPTPLPISAPAS